MNMRLFEITTTDLKNPKVPADVKIPANANAAMNTPATDKEAPQPDARFATRKEIAQLAANMTDAIPGVRFDVDSKATIKDVPYIRIFGSDKQTITNYLKQFGLDPIPLEPKQAAISSKYRSNILSYNAGDVIYSMVVAGSGKKDDNDAGVNVSIKEFTPTTLGLAGKAFNRQQLIKSTQDAVVAKTSTRPELQQILLELIQVAAGTQSALSPEANANLSERARNQLSVDFGEILAPIKMAQKNDAIEFPAEGNFPLIDVVIGKNKYSVKSLTGSGTSFKSIQDLMDNFEKTMEKDDKQEKLFALFKAYHPKAGGKNVDKVIRAAAYLGLPEYKQAVKILGGKFQDWNGLQSLVSAQGIGNSKNEKAYGAALKYIYPILTAGNWGKPTGLPSDGNYYMHVPKDKAKPAEKEAGYPSFRADPAKAITDILTYALGVATLNSVTRGPDAKEYEKMMTNIVNQSPAWLGRLDITDNGQVVSSAKPFTDLQFKFQYHAPSHKPGNNLPGFMIVY
jgi:hypothetical protein